MIPIGFSLHRHIFFSFFLLYRNVLSVYRRFITDLSYNVSLSFQAPHIVLSLFLLPYSRIRDCTHFEVTIRTFVSRVVKNDNASHRKKEKWFLRRISGKKIFHEIHAPRIDIFPDEIESKFRYLASMCRRDKSKKR